MDVLAPDTQSTTLTKYQGGIGRVEVVVGTELETRMACEWRGQQVAVESCRLVLCIGESNQLSSWCR